MIELVFVAFALAGADPVAVERAFSAAADVAVVAEEDGQSDRPLLPTPEQTALLLLSIGHHESRWDAGAVTPQGDCGVAQVRAFWFGGHSCDELRADGRLGYRAALEALRTYQRRCGGPAERWLGAYASGRCGGVPSRARALCGPVHGCGWRGHV